MELLENFDIENFYFVVDVVFVVNCVYVLYSLMGNEVVLEKLVFFLCSLNFEVVMIFEVEVNYNGVNFMVRFVEVLYYYCVLFDVLEGCLVCDSFDWFCIENIMLFVEIWGIVILEGGVGYVWYVKFEVW